MITDSLIEKNGKKIKKVSLMFIGEDSCLCDGCDEIKKCSRLNDLSDNVMVICKGCLEEIVVAF